ncbi:MAG: glycosyltransferase family 2 protein [Colwellia sp.]
MYFSIVIPVYNGDKTISKALASVANQTMTNFEVIVINDGSTDSTLSEAQKFVALHPNLDITIISNQNQGRSVARNIGIIMAKGDFICFLDADDELKEHHLAEFSKAISRYPEVGFFFADGETHRQDDSWAEFSGFLARLMKRGDCWEIEGDYVLFNDDFANTLALGSLIPMCSTAIKRDVLALSGLFNPSFSVGEDFELWFRISLTNRMIAINKKLSNIYHHEDNTSNPKNSYRNTIKSLKVNKHILENTSNLNSNLLTIFNKKISSQLSSLLYYASYISPTEVLTVMSDHQVVKYGHVAFSVKQLIKSILIKTFKRRLPQTPS